MALMVNALTQAVVFGATGIDEVVQNVRTILTTRKGSVPLDRELGLDFSVLDSPLPKAQAALQSDIFLQVQKYEPRAVITRIAFANEPLSGRLLPTVYLEVNL